MKIQAYESELAMVGPCAVCGDLVRIKEHDVVHRLEGMGGVVCAQCVAKQQPEVVPTADTTEGVRLVIKHNNALTADPCAICGENTQPAIGPELFLEDSWQVICHECGETYAPALVALLRLGRAADMYAASGRSEADRGVAEE